MNNIKSILIIDDNEDDIFITKSLIKRSAYPVKVFTMPNGREALDFLKNHEVNKEKYNDDFPPSLILLDINMPVLNGFEFLDKFNELKENPLFSSSIIMMFTSSDNPNDKKKSFEYDTVKNFLKKPISIASYESIIRRFSKNII